MKMVVEQDFLAPASFVFERTMDIKSWPQTVTAIKSVEILTPGPVGVGTRFRETRKMFGQDASEEMTFSEIVPNEKFVLTAYSHGTRYHTEHAFQDNGSGTRLTLTFEGVPETITARVMAPVGWLLCGSLKKILAGDLADVKRATEAAYNDVTPGAA